VTQNVKIDMGSPRLYVSLNWGKRDRRTELEDRDLIRFLLLRLLRYILIGLGTIVPLGLLLHFDPCPLADTRSDCRACTHKVRNK